MWRKIKRLRPYFIVAAAVIVTGIAFVVWAMMLTFVHLLLMIGSRMG